MTSFMRLVTTLLLTALVGAAGVGVATAAPATTTLGVVAAVPPSCGINDNLSLTADQFLSKCVLGSVRREFPTPLLGVTVQNIRDNRSLNNDYKKAWKFISQTRFRR